MCLQKNLGKKDVDISDECRWAVGNFTEDEDEDISLDRILMQACTPMIKKFCQVSCRFIAMLCHIRHGKEQYVRTTYDIMFVN